MSELLAKGLGEGKGAFRGHDANDMLTAVQLRQWLVNADKSNTFSGMKVGRIWDDWEDADNDGDILLYREGNGVVQV